MPKFRYIYGGSEANWIENLYHRSLPVVGGVCETDDDLDIEALLRLGWEPIAEEEADPVPVAKTPRAKANKD